MRNPKEAFVTLLSDARQATERSTKIFQELSQAALDPEIKEALKARAYIANQNLDTLDECFKVIGEQPVKLSGRIYDVFLEDFRREVIEIQSPAARRLFILAKASHLVHWRVGEYMLLIAAADEAGYAGVGVLLESCLANKLAFVDRARRFLHEMREELAVAA
jgi:ferritin-like metal-binding protein YciE